MTYRKKIETDIRKTRNPVKFLNYDHKKAFDMKTGEIFEEIHNNVRRILHQRIHILNKKERMVEPIKINHVCLYSMLSQYNM